VASLWSTKGGRGAARATVLAASVIGCGGGGPSLPSGQTWTSTHFVYAARAGDAGACDGVADRLEAHFALLNAYLGLTWPGGAIRYYKYQDGADLGAHSDCAALAVGCSNDHVVQSPLALDGHELVHVYVRHLGRPPAMFEEGLAEALSPRGRVFSAPTQSWRDVLGTPALAGGVPPPIAYWGGAWFVSYLLRQQGPASFVALYSALAQDADEAAVAGAFQQVYGAALDDVWQQAQSSDPAEEGVPLWECAADTIVLGGAAADLSDRCDGRGSFATFTLAAEDAVAWQAVTLTSGFNVASCDLGHELHAEQLAWPLETGALALPAGSYYVAPMAGTGALGLVEAPNGVTRACVDAAPLLLPAASSNLTLAIGDGPDAWFVRLHPEQAASVTLAREWDDPIVPDVMVATVEICTDCSTACQPFDNAVATPVADGQVLRISGLTAPAGATVARFSYR
jgi:hypothetical protein